MRDLRTEVVSFWFEETQPVQWFHVSSDFDDQVRERFLDLYFWAMDGHCRDWEHDAVGSLALVLLFDQFPRMMFRNMAQAYASDVRAVTVARQAIVSGFDQIAIPLRRKFYYFPFLHSESLADQEFGVARCCDNKLHDPLVYEGALRSLEIIKRFGRFPDRNVVLGRISTDAECAYIKGDKSE